MRGTVKALTGILVLSASGLAGCQEQPPATSDEQRAVPAPVTPTDTAPVEPGPVTTADTALVEPTPVTTADTAPDARSPDETPRDPEPTVPADPPNESADAAESSVAAVTAADEADARDTPADDFRSWPAPAVALLVTGEMMGYFEPCGCSANQLGGMSRRAALHREVTEKGWTVRGLDLGSLSRRSGRQTQLKFETTLSALRALDYSAIGLGPEELRLNPEYLISQHVQDGSNPLRLVSANVVFYESPDLGTPLPWTLIEAGGVRIGVTSVMSDSVRRLAISDKKDNDDGLKDITWKPPGETLPAVLKLMDDEQVAFRVLLSQSSLEESRALASEFPTFDLIVSAQGFGEGEARPEQIGSVRLLQVGEKGRTAGVLGIFPDEPDHRTRFSLVHLTGERFGDDAAMIALMQSYQDRLKDERIVLAEPAIPHSSGARFVGAEKCGECHTTAFAIWKDTPHAHALESLDPAHQRTGHERLHGVNRSYDPECLSCHVTGWQPQEYLRFTSGFLNEEFAATSDEKQLHTLLAGNQCENCHGPGSQHVELVEADNLEQARLSVRVTLEQARDHQCITCHDLDNSPDFDFDSYWKEVEHAGVD